MEKIIETFNTLGYKVFVVDEKGKPCGYEIEKWTNGGVDMIHSLDFRGKVADIANKYAVRQEFYAIATDFEERIDEEIDLHRESEDYRRAFTIRQSVNDFEAYAEEMKNDCDKFIETYNSIA